MRPTALQYLTKGNAVCRRAMDRMNRTQKAALSLFSFTILTPALHAFPLDSDDRRNRVVKERRLFSFSNHFESIVQIFFQRLCKVTFAQFRELCTLLRPYIEKRITRTAGRGNTPSVEVRLCITLRQLRGASYLDVGWPCGVGKATVYTIFEETLHGLNKCLPQITFRTTEAECRQKANHFRIPRRSPINGIVAAMDGIAIAIQQPRLNETPDPRKYYNRRGFYSICLQAAVGADYKFMFVSARHAGGTHDSTAFHASVLYDAFLQNLLPSWIRIAAADAYSNGGYILSPYSGPNLPQVKDSFNLYLSSCRITIEQDFGMLVSRFGIFWSPLRCSLKTDTLIIIVACKLRNFIINSRDESNYNIVAKCGEGWYVRCRDSPRWSFRRRFCFLTRDALP